MGAADARESRTGRWMPGRGTSRLRWLVLALALAGGLVVSTAARSAVTARDRTIPPPAVDEHPGDAQPRTAVLAGGCFWGVQGVFQHVGGVVRAVSGYAGGEAHTAHYRLVGLGDTGHAEAVAITYDAREVTYGTLLRVFFSVAHDPTQRNRQGPDEGREYRSAIFPADAEQARIAAAYIAQLDAAQVFDAPIATTIEPDRPFYPAEAYHQDFLARHPYYPYIVVNDLPKIAALRRLFPDRYREPAALVNR